MNIDYLRYFISACESGSIQSASKQLFVSAQGMGKGIQRLEESLGLRLLERTQSGAVPTEFGKLYYDQAKIVEKEMLFLMIAEAEGIKVTAREYEKNVEKYMEDQGFSSEEELISTVGEDRFMGLLTVDKAIVHLQKILREAQK